MRLHLFEFEDQDWFPHVIRQGGTDYLRYLLKVTNYYKPIAPLIKTALDKTGDSTLVDLCSGGGGNIEEIQKHITSTGKEIRIILTDKFPNVRAYGHLKARTAGRIDFIGTPVDAAAVPSNMKGFRVMFSAFHHFKPHIAKTILKNAVDNHAGIAIFDGGDKSILTMLSIMLFHPFGFFFATPFFKPFSLLRLLFTYLLPLIPLTTIWDGVVSIARLYKPEEMLTMAKEIDDGKYLWKAGKVKNGVGMSVAYLIGYPKS